MMTLINRKRNTLKQITAQFKEEARWEFLQRIIDSYNQKKLQERPWLEIYLKFQLPNKRQPNQKNQGLRVPEVRDKG